MQNLTNTIKELVTIHTHIRIGYSDTRFNLKYRIKDYFKAQSTITFYLCYIVYCKLI